MPTTQSCLADGEAEWEGDGVAEGEADGDAEGEAEAEADCEAGGSPRWLPVGLLATGTMTRRHPAPKQMAGGPEQASPPGNCNGIWGRSPCSIESAMARGLSTMLKTLFRNFPPRTGRCFPGQTEGQHVGHQGLAQ